MVRGRLVEVNGKPLDTTQYRDARAPAGRARVQPVVDRPDCREGNRIVAGTFWTPQARGADAGISLEDGIARDARRQARRHADVRHRRHPRHRARDEPAQGRLGQFPRELLRAVRAGRARHAAGDLHRGVSRAGRQSRRGSPGSSRAIRTSSRSTSPRSCSRSRASSIASRAPSSSCSCSRSPAACWCCRRRSRRRRTSASSTRPSCARSARRSGSCRARRRPSSCCSGRSPGCCGAAGATAIGWALAEHVFNIRFTGNRARLAVRHRRRRDRRHAGRLARHAVDGERAAAHGTAPTRLDPAGSSVRIA